ncbi:MAG TPA: hypothetical protein VGD50_00430 [Candidatus Baltobacteraceae bacterium]
MKSLSIALFAAVLCSAGAGVACADPTPAPHGLPSIPAGILNNPYVQSVINALGGITQSTTGNKAYGKVSYFKRFELQVQTAPSVFREVHLHQGTVINPRGTTLSQGMTVVISGNPQSDGSLNADEVDVR